ncbi:rCG39140 [Rattus norvegicus]|uniref:RCG39140 n=1 Tax=Rattus norvegicus TaxID=10116 RepID=A6JY79_RAT|nr:rCG39140 [Rattus norvegicus]
MCPPNRKVGYYAHVWYTSTIYSCGFENLNLVCL